MTKEEESELDLTIKEPKYDCVIKFENGEYLSVASSVGYLIRTKTLKAAYVFHSKWDATITSLGFKYQNDPNTVERL